MIDIGFTGTREGMNPTQTKFAQYIIAGLQYHHEEVTLHMGCCIGADEEFALLCRNSGFKIVGHPPTFTKFLSTFVCDETKTPKSYLSRDEDIVDSSILLIAAPKTSYMLPNSGTWFTINYAKKLHKPVLYLMPS